MVAPTVGQLLVDVVQIPGHEQRLIFVAVTLLYLFGPFDVSPLSAWSRGSPVQSYHTSLGVIGGCFLFPDFIHSFQTTFDVYTLGFVSSTMITVRPELPSWTCMLHSTYKLSER